MDINYTNERNVQIVISLLKAHGIRKVIASPGGTNMTFVASIQQDPFFEIYSSVDERSAGYIACGLAAETGETVVLSCTGATSSRNYLPALTEAYYRKLPILAITSGRDISNVGHLVDQVIDRSVLPNDVAKLSVHIPEIKDKEDEWNYTVKVNKAILELRRNGNGPVHINLPTTYSRDFSVKEIPSVRKIYRINKEGKYPVMPIGNIGIFVGSHLQWSKALTNTVDKFCETNNAVVLCDHTSNYKGKYKILFSLIESQNQSLFKKNELDLIVHIGEVSGSGYNNVKEVWRISEDGEIRDTFRKLTYMFDMSELDFFNHYIRYEEIPTHNLYNDLRLEYDELLDKVPELPFSNIWIAQFMSQSIPENSVLHLGIRNSLRSWNFFEIPDSVLAFSNVGGFGIDGGVSSLIGSSFANKDKIYFGVFGDLAFFYDMNCLGNHHIGNNIRILLVNNGGGQEFRNHNSMGAMFGENTDSYISAGGHYGNKSKNLVRHYVEDLGFEYLTASNKEDFIAVCKAFTTDAKTTRPLLLEIFTTNEEERDALKIISSLSFSGKLLESARGILKGKTFNTVKKIIKK